MSRDYVLRESPTQRKSLIKAVLLSTITCSSKAIEGESVSITLGFELAQEDYRSELIKKLESGAPIEEIPEFQRWLREMEQSFAIADEEREHWRALGKYRKNVQDLTKKLFSAPSPPTSSDCDSLIAFVKQCPLAEEEPQSLDDLRGTFSRHPWLKDNISLIVGHLRFIERAKNEHRQYFIARMWSAWSRFCAEKKDRSFDDSDGNLERFDYDEPEEIYFGKMLYLFSGKFKYGTRRKCQEKVIAHGAEVCENGTRWADYLVVASGEENTSPRSSSCAPVLQSRAAGWPCFIISEETWAQSLISCS